MLVKHISHPCQCEKSVNFLYFEFHNEEEKIYVVYTQRMFITN